MLENILKGQPPRNRMRYCVKQVTLIYLQLVSEFISV